MKNDVMQSIKTKKIVGIILGFILVFTGVSDVSFMLNGSLQQLPNWSPMQPDMFVLLSGGVEIFLGTGLIFLPKQQTSVCWIVAVFLVAIFLGKIAQLVNYNYAFGLNSHLLLWLRLPFQTLLIALVLWSTGVWIKWRSKIKFKNQVYVLWPQ